MKHELGEEIARLLFKIALRREDLSTAAFKRTGWRKKLNFAAGLTSVFSGGAVLAALETTLPHVVLQWIGAATAFLAGTASLLTLYFLSENETATMFKGAAQYLALREGLIILTINQKLSEGQRLRTFTDLAKEYGRLDEVYGLYFTPAGRQHYLWATGHPINREQWLKETAQKEVDLILKDLGVGETLPPKT